MNNLGITFPVPGIRVTDRSQTPKLPVIYKVFLGDFGELGLRTGARPVLSSTEKNGWFRPVIYFARALDRRLDPDYIRDEGRERELECYISCYYWWYLPKLRWQSCWCTGCYSSSFGETPETPLNCWHWDIDLRSWMYQGAPGNLFLPDWKSYAQDYWNGCLH